MTLRIDITDMPVLDRFADLEAFDHTEAGVYKILYGSRGCIEEVERLGSLEEVTYVDVPTLGECIKSMSCGVDEEEVNIEEYVEEFYHIEKNIGTGEMFMTWTEEECDVYVRVNSLQ
jgi:hypothetical protein